MQDFDQSSTHLEESKSSLNTSDSYLGGIDLKCDQCDNRENVWVCMVCAALGCGRYCSGRHAVKHFQATNHSFSLELSSQRIWHYKGDNYVHRIIKTQLNVNLHSILKFELEEVISDSWLRNHSGPQSTWLNWIFLRGWESKQYESSWWQASVRKDRQHSQRVQLSPNFITGGTEKVLRKQGMPTIQEVLSRLDCDQSSDVKSKWYHCLTRLLPRWVISIAKA